ncbi:hypothetical protein L3X38_025835 [Prunus dulcis]|uniref:Uncharacterized protein n=1 Tax=Prunus dulcis TaxID=3755 RepID=A0AAD4W500_PRUDU|nr:hypothetical protein L3X38_025835 [Prunus dulcis]
MLCLIVQISQRSTSLKRMIRHMSIFKQLIKSRVVQPGAVAAGIQQPHVNHELHPMKLLRPRARLDSYTLRGLVRKFPPTVVFLMETKSKNNKIESLKHNYGFQKGFSKPPVGSAGGLSLWWDDNIDLEVKGFSKYFIDIIITDNQRGTHYMERHIERRRRLAGTFWRVSSDIPTFHGYAVVISTKSYGLLRKGVVRSSLPTDPTTFTTSWRRRGSLIWVTRDRASLGGLTCRMVFLFKKDLIEFWGTYYGRSHGLILPLVTTRPSVRITIHWSWRQPCIIKIIEGS